MPYLAMTAAEFRLCTDLPEHLAWMAIHFSPYSSGLTNLPSALPTGSLLILDDSSPIAGHDAARVCRELQKTAEKFECCGVLLDFERPQTDKACAMVEKVLTLPCPVCVAAAYALDFDCPVFLPPIPMLQMPAAYLHPWVGREIWLDCSPTPTTVTVTEKGSQTAPLSPGKIPDCPHFDDELFCHYRLDLDASKAVFTLHRTLDDLSLLLHSAKKWGVTHGVGLWQEFRL